MGMEIGTYNFLSRLEREMSEIAENDIYSRK